MPFYVAVHGSPDWLRHAKSQGEFVSVRGDLLVLNYRPSASAGVRIIRTPDIGAAPAPLNGVHRQAVLCR